MTEKEAGTKHQIRITSAREQESQSVSGTKGGLNGSGAKGNPLHRLIRSYPTFEEFVQTYNETETSSDRAAAILAAASSEWSFEAAIVAHLSNVDQETLEKLTGRDGALSSFYGNIYLAYAMEIIDDTERDDLNTIRTLRNVFAHAMTYVTFSRPEISNKCSTLVSRYVEAIPLVETSGSEERRRYIEVARHLGFKLLMKASDAYGSEGTDEGSEGLPTQG